MNGSNKVYKRSKITLSIEHSHCSILLGVVSRGARMSCQPGNAERYRSELCSRSLGKCYWFKARQVPMEQFVSLVGYQGLKLCVT
jgi:hypothetical protein